MILEFLPDQQHPPVMIRMMVMVMVMVMVKMPTKEPGSPADEEQGALKGEG